MIEQLHFPAFERSKRDINFNTPLMDIFKDYPQLRSYIENNINSIILKNKTKVTIEGKIFDIFKLLHNSDTLYLVNTIQPQKNAEVTHSFDSIYDFAMDFIYNTFQPEHLSLFEKKGEKLSLIGFRGKNIFKKKTTVLLLDEVPNIKESCKKRIQSEIKGEELKQIVKDTFRKYNFISIPLYKMNYFYGIMILAGKFDYSQIKDTIYKTTAFLGNIIFEHKMSEILKVLRTLQKELFVKSYLFDSEGFVFFPPENESEQFDEMNLELPKFEDIVDIVDRTNPYIVPVNRNNFYIISKRTIQNNSFYFVGKQNAESSIFNYNFDTNYQSILSNFFSDAPFGLFVQVSDHIIYYNKQFLNMFPAFLADKNMEFFSLISKSDKKKHLKEELFGKGFLNSRVDITRNNTVYVYNLFLNTFKNKFGMHIIGIVVDITNVAIYEKEIIELKKREALQNLSSIIGNQINNLLQPIVGYASYLKMVAGDNEEIKEIVSKIEQSTIMATDLIRRVPLKIKRPGEVIDLFEESKNIVEIIDLIKPDNIKIYYKGEEKNYCSLISNMDFNQIMLNLIYNSLEAIDKEGKIEISFDAIHINDKEKIRIYGLKNQDFVHITINDTGIGIEERAMRDIFKPFYTTKNGGHSGLGLSMVLEIIENNNGFIEIVSKKSIGTDVNVYLPQYPCDKEKSLLAIEEHKISHIEDMLVIEDNEIVSSFIDSILSNLHISHYITKNAEEGISYMRKRGKAISHIYLDFNIPRISIIDLYKTLHSLNENAKFILSSGYFEAEKLQTLLKLNKDIMILKKPFDYNAFIKSIQSE